MSIENLRGPGIRIFFPTYLPERGKTGADRVHGPQIERLTKMFREAVKVGEEYGIQMAIENHIDFTAVSESLPIGYPVLHVG